ncbi:hypothetical protein [Streptomyces sp. NPDC089919]|uniref:hypothetical protein n=1 Tax=Streptomyces sp. NPDC089919 TaxID=3155188 RepID=UPI0034331144
MAEVGSFGHEAHPWIGEPVTDIASQASGKLTAVVREPVVDHRGSKTTVRLAYIKPASGVEWSTAVANIELDR